MRVFSVIHLTFAVVFFGLALSGCENIKDTPTIDIVTKELCDKRIVLLGENGFHRDGATITYKTELVQNLVNKCGFNVILFEASFYDALAIRMKMRKGEDITPAMVSSALGWIYKQNEEIAPLFPFLHKHVVSGNVILGGIDDQTGARGSFYSLDQMVVDLTTPLSTEIREFCRARLKQRIWYNFPKTTPYTTEKYEKIQSCLTAIKTAVSKENSNDTNEYLEMLANIERNFARDFTDRKSIRTKRDHSMFLNSVWHIEHASPTNKFIIWSTNGHLAKNATTSPTYPNGGNLGSYIYEKYGTDSFALGFTALSGNYRYSAEQIYSIPVAPDNALEAQAFATARPNTTYLNEQQLTKVGRVPGALFSHKYHMNAWNQSFDGIIVLRNEQASKPVEKKESPSTKK